MTLHTRVLIEQPHPVADVLAFINTELLHAPAARPDDEPGGMAFEDGETSIGNALGQGLAAWTWITYRPDGPIVATRYVGDDDAGNEVHHPVGAGSMIVHFDTAYGYTGDHGEGCAELHAGYIRALAERFGPVVWLDEFRGEWSRFAAGDSVDTFRAFSGT